MYISSVGKLINFINETSHNYLSVEDEIIDKFYSHKNKCDFFDEITNYPINDLLNIKDPQFVKYMVFYMICHGKEETIENYGFDFLLHFTVFRLKPSVINFSFGYGNIEILFQNNYNFDESKQIKLSDGNNTRIHHDIRNLLFSYNYCSFCVNEIVYIYNLQNMSEIVVYKNQINNYFTMFDYLFITKKEGLYLWTDGNNLELVSKFKSHGFTFSDYQIKEYYKLASKIIKYKERTVRHKIKCTQTDLQISKLLFGNLIHINIFYI